MPHYGRLFRVLSSSISQRMTSALGEMDLTSAQGHIIGYLAHCKEPPCPRDLEETFHLSHPTVSGLLARLEKKGFLELTADPNDRRCKRIHMLAKGWDCDERIYGTILENEERIVQGFSEEEKAQFADFLTRAAQNLGCKPHFFIEEESDSC